MAQVTRSLPPRRETWMEFLASRHSGMTQQKEVSVSLSLTMLPNKINKSRYCSCFTEEETQPHKGTTGEWWSWGSEHSQAIEALQRKL